IGLIVSHGPLMLLELPLVAAAVFALTAVTYQFQGWLASLMANPRRRRTIIVLVTGGFILIAQLPNLVNIAWTRGAVTGPVTRRLYTGQYTAAERKAAAKAPAAPPDPTRVRLVEWRLPWVGEHVSAVATAGLRSLTRAPEAKMAFLAPLVVVVVFGGIVASEGGNQPAALRPVLAYGAGGMVLFVAGV